MALQNLRSSTPSKRPDASSMSDGQIALNTAAASAGLFFKDSNGDLVKAGPVHIGTTAPNSTPATGGSTGNSRGEAWLDTSNSNYVLKIYDGTAFRSVEMAAGSARQLLQTNAAGTDVEFTSNVDVPGTLDVTGATTLDSTASVAGLLSANGKISFAEGNAAAPGIYPGSDTNTGISSPTADEISISTAGSSRLYIDSTGNIGVGTSNPGSLLDIASNSNTSLRLTDSNQGSYSEFLYNDNGSNVSSLVISVDAGNTSTPESQLRFRLDGSEKMRLANSGLGIGTSNPSFPLEVNRTDTGTVVSSFESATHSAYLNVASTNTDLLNVRFGAIGNDAVIQAGASEAMRIKSDGKIGIGESNPQEKLHISANNSAIGSNWSNANNLIRIEDTDSSQSNGQVTGGIVFEGNDSDAPGIQAGIIAQSGSGTGGGDIAFHTAASGTTLDGTESARMVIDSNGQIGVGTSNPASRLEVNGFIQSSSGLKFNDTDSNYGLFPLGTQTLTFNINGGEKARITADGNLGIGDNDPASKLTVNGSIQSSDGLKFNDIDNNYGLFPLGTQTLAFNINGGEKARINANGFLGVNHTNPQKPLQVGGSNNMVRLASSTAAARIEYQNSGSSTADSTSIGSVNNDLQFITSGSEKARINSVGNFGVGESNPPAKLTVTPGGSSSTAYAGRSLNYGALVHTVSGRSGYIVQNTNAFTSANDNAGFQWLYPFNSGGDSDYKVFRSAVGTTLDDKFWVNQGGGAYFANSVGIGSGAIGATPWSNADELVIKNNGPTGLSIIGPDDDQANIIFGNPADNIGSIIRWMRPDNELQVGTHSTDGFVTIKTAVGQERVRVTKDGSVGIGTSNPAYKLDVEGGSSSSQFTTTANWNFSTVYLKRKASNASLAKMISMMLDGDSASETDFTNNLTIWGTYNSTPTTGSTSNGLNAGMNLGAPGGILFHVNSSERMRIDSNGNILCGMTSPAISSLYTLQATGTRGAIIKSTGGGGNPTQTLWNQNSSGDSTLLEFRVNTTDTTVGNIVHDRSAGLVDYNTTSDYRSKTLNGRVENSGSIIDQLKVYNGTMHGATIELPMLVAHEAQEVVPYCVTGEKDAVDSEGNPIYQGMDVSKLVPLLIAEIQELRKRLSDAGL